MNTKRDKFLVACFWVSAISFTISLACLSVLFPLAYCYVMACVGSVAILGGTLVVCGMLFNDGGILGWYFAGQMLEASFKIIGVIFLALAQAASGSSD